jgi:chromate reductase, NAD(P)H dehydrogenase (quinone)
MPAVLKNLLEWTIGDASTYRKPVAWINASSPAAPTGGADAHESLEKVLRYAGADSRQRLHPSPADPPARRPVGLVEDEAARRAMANALATLVDHARAC